MAIAYNHEQDMIEFVYDNSDEGVLELVECLATLFNESEVFRAILAEGALLADADRKLRLNEMFGELGLDGDDIVN